jgi:hypothetical protein
MEIFLIDFLEIDEGLEQLKEEAARLYPDRSFVPFWRLLLRDNELVLRATVSDGKPGPQESVELIKKLDKKPEGAPVDRDQWK